MRKSDPKIPEGFNQESEVQTHNSGTNGSGNLNQSEGPLDMSVRQRGQPPSYSQTINNPGYRSSYRPTVITQTPQRDDAPSGLFKSKR